MENKYLLVIIIFLIIGAGIFFVFLSGDNPNDGTKNGEKVFCDEKEIIFYYLDGCSWCQKVKEEGTISKLEALGVKVKQVDAAVGPLEHQFRGVPTFVIDGKVYSGYKTFEDLVELLNCEKKEDNPSANEKKETEFDGEKGETVFLVDEKIILGSSTFSDGLAHYYNTELPDGTVIYFFVLRDKAGIYRAAANACQVCFDTRMGFRQEGDYMVCNTCGNKYPLTKIATEKGGCNPAPINPNLEIKGDEVIIKLSDIEQVAEFF